MIIQSKWQSRSLTFITQNPIENNEKNTKRAKKFTQIQNFLNDKV